ncbi:MAG: phospholipase D family protein [Parahaliea sp.]
MLTWRRLLVMAGRLLIVGSLVLLNSCSSLPEAGTYQKTLTEALPADGNTSLAKAIAHNIKGNVKAGDVALSGFHPLYLGMDAFVARMALVEAAERSLDVQYYMWHSDTSGILLANQLILAADRGVRVRLLLDDLRVEGKDDFLIRMDAHPNIDVRLYNPFAYRGMRGIGFLGDFSRLNHRMHNKSLTADNEVTIVGGRNIGNEYFNATAQTTFSDLDVVAIGPVVGKVSDMFDLYWNSDVAIPVGVMVDETDLSPQSLQVVRSHFNKIIQQEMQSAYVEAIHDAGVINSIDFRTMNFYWGKATLIYDDPDKVFNDEITANTHLAPKLIPMFLEANREIQVVSPYFVPGNKLLTAFCDLVDKGIRLRILTNSLAANDVGLVHAGYMRYRKKLLKCGAELYEFKPDPILGSSKKRWTGSSAASLHAKTMGADGEQIFVGSFNLDPRSVALNTEMGVIIKNPELGTQLAEGFDELVQNKAYQLLLQEGDLRWVDKSATGSQVYNVEPETSWWQRVLAKSLSFIVPESML